MERVKSVNENHIMLICSYVSIARHMYTAGFINTIQYLLTCKVSRYCILSLHGSTVPHSFADWINICRLSMIADFTHLQISSLGSVYHRITLYTHFLIVVARLNPQSAKLHKLNFQPLEVVSRYRDPQLQVGENYSYLFNWRPNICKS